MKKGSLAQYFEGVAAKRLSAVEADRITSRQHEFNGVVGLRQLLAEPDGKSRYTTKFLYVTDDEGQPLIEDGFLTWYDSRQKGRLERGVQRSEYRLYFPTNRVSQCARTGDLLVIAKRPSGTLLAIVAEQNSSIAQQMVWLFGLSDLDQPDFFIRDERALQSEKVELASRLILDSIGVVVEETADTYLEALLHKFGGGFPPTREFSAYARSTLRHVKAQEGPDEALMAWMDREEILFRTLERHLVVERLKTGFGEDVDSFMSFSLSVQNRRKSRAGLALENHLSLLFTEFGINHARAAVTENRSKPDFLFPGRAEYLDPRLDASKLTMLGCKSTCKDRWRQILAEAARIETKHLLTLEAAISVNQTNEMRAHKVHLIVPSELHASYAPSERAWLMNVADLVALLLDKQQISTARNRVRSAAQPL